MVNCNGPRQPAFQIDLGIMRNHGKMADYIGDASPTPGTRHWRRLRPQPPRKFRPHGAGGCQNRRCIAGRSGIRLGSHDYCWVEVVPSASFTKIAPWGCAGFGGYCPFRAAPPLVARCARGHFCRRSLLCLPRTLLIAHGLSPSAQSSPRLRLRDEFGQL